MLLSTFLLTLRTHTLQTSQMARMLEPREFGIHLLDSDISCAFEIAKKLETDSEKVKRMESLNLRESAYHGRDKKIICVDFELRRHILCTDEAAELILKVLFHRFWLV